MIRSNPTVEFAEPIHRLDSKAIVEANTESRGLQVPAAAKVPVIPRCPTTKYPRKRKPQPDYTDWGLSFDAWQRPTLTWLMPHYHRRCTVSLPSSRWIGWVQYAMTAKQTCGDEPSLCSPHIRKA